MKILLSAYACEPGRGSEPGVGWNWTRQLATQHEVWVITRSNNRGPIEAALAREPLPNAHFLYFDLPPWARFWKRGSLGLQMYYYLWQIGAYFKARDIARGVQFDFVQHVTFVKYWMPSLVSLIGRPFIWGPVGGGDTAPPAFRANFSLRGRLYDSARSAARTLCSLDPFLALTARRALTSLATTEETAARLRALGCRDVRLFFGVALNDDDLALLATVRPRQEAPFRIISIGNLLHLKAFDLSMQAFAAYLSRGGRGEYWLVGDGPERSRLEAMAQTLGIAGQVRFWGRLSRIETLQRLAECDVLAYPSLHDSGGWTCLEAMAAARPVVCLDLGGPGVQITPETGIKLPAQNPDQVIAAMTIAFETLAANPDLRLRMGEAGRARVSREYRWRDKPERLLSVFEPAAPGLEAGLRKGAVRP